MAVAHGRSGAFGSLDPSLACSGLGLGQGPLELRPLGLRTAVPLELDERCPSSLAFLAGRALLGLDLVDAGARALALRDQPGPASSPLTTPRRCSPDQVYGRRPREPCPPGSRTAVGRPTARA
jgi:hypothetical protein